MAQRLVCVMLLAAIGCGDKSDAAACVAPSGKWSIELQSDDSTCEEQSLEDVELEQVSDGCVIASQSFDDEACIFTQRAKCDGFTGTLVLTLNAAGNKIAGGTSTIEADDGTTCDYEVKGHK